MARTNAFEAHNEARREMNSPGMDGALAGAGRRVLMIERKAKDIASYPEVPAGWPSRVVRRAVKLGREFRLPKPWVGVLADPTMVPVMVNGMLDHVTRGALLRRHIRMM